MAGLLRWLACVCKEQACCSIAAALAISACRCMVERDRPAACPRPLCLPAGEMLGGLRV